MGWTRRAPRRVAGVSLGVPTVLTALFIATVVRAWLGLRREAADALADLEKAHQRAQDRTARTTDAARKLGMTFASGFEDGSSTASASATSTQASRRTCCASAAARW